jgi:hypothetical protein
MLIVKWDLFVFIKKPISIKLFGKNKTYRGLIFVPVVNSFLSFVFFDDMILTGFVLGFTYMLFELPNSFVKRKMGILAGQKATKNRTLFLILDKSDSTFGISLVYCFLYNLGPLEFLVLFFMAFLIHLTLSVILHKVKIKESV